MVDPGDEIRDGGDGCPGVLVAASIHGSQARRGAVFVHGFLSSERGWDAPFLALANIFGLGTPL
jgi:hypothetical protein